MKILPAFLLLWVLLAAQAWGNVQPTPLTQTADLLAFAMELYHEKHGALPQQWSDLDEFGGRELDQLFPGETPSKRYAFVRVPVALNDEQILAILRKPCRHESLGQARLAIYKRRSGSMGFRWMQEQYVAQLFAAAGQPLPEPDNEPESPSVAAERRARMWKMGLLAAVFLFPLTGAMAWRWALRRNSARHLVGGTG